MKIARTEGGHSPNSAHILVVDDDRRLRELLSRYLGDNEFRVSIAKDVVEARARCRLFEFDCVILDVMMPGESGFDFIGELRKTSSIPVLMLTARIDADDRVKGLELGADDYLSKPFEPRELLLRLNNLLRRMAAPSVKPSEPQEFVRFGPYRFRLDRAELKRDDDTIRLTDRERELLQILARNAGEAVPREAIAGDDELGERTVDVQINRLRRKIEIDPSNPVHLQTVRGFGYRLLVD
jgi:two-component system, OmpR family, phosphate regulon response regulator OmpR